MVYLFPFSLLAAYKDLLLQTDLANRTQACQLMLSKCKATSARLAVGPSLSSTIAHFYLGEDIDNSWLVGADLQYFNMITWWRTTINV